MATIDRYVCDNPACGAIVYMEARYRVRAPHCVRCRSALTQHGTAQLASSTSPAGSAPCPVCGQPEMIQQHAGICPYAEQQTRYGIPLATYLVKEVEVEAWDDRSSRWVPLIRAFNGLNGPEAVQELVERHIPHMRLQAALIWERQPENRAASLPDSSQDSYSWRSMEAYPHPVLQVIHGPVKSPQERHSWPAHYFRFKQS